MGTEVTRAELEACARLAGYQFKGFINDKISYFDPVTNHAGVGDWDPRTNDADLMALARAAKLRICYDANYARTPGGTFLFSWPTHGTESACIIKAAAAVQIEREKQQ